MKVLRLEKSLETMKPRFAIEITRSPLEAYLDGVRFPRTRRVGAPFTVACPVCGAPQYHSCVSVAGNVLEMSHSRRMIIGCALVHRRHFGKSA